MAILEPTNSLPAKWIARYVLLFAGQPCSYHCCIGQTGRAEKSVTDKEMLNRHLMLPTVGSSEGCSIHTSLYAENE